MLSGSTMQGLCKHCRLQDKFGFVNRDGHVVQRSMDGIDRRILASVRPSLQTDQASSVHALWNARHGVYDIGQAQSQFQGILLVGVRRAG